MKTRQALITITALLITVLMNITGCSPTSVPPTLVPVTPTAALPVLTAAWVEAGNLMIWHTGDDFPRRIASSAVIRPVLSPNGRSVAFTRGPQGRALALWLADASGTIERELAGQAALSIDIDPAIATRQIGQVDWLDSQTLLFNTVFAPVVPAPGGGRADDLWWANARTGEIRRLLPDGQGGNFSVSPDGALVALVTPGFYGGPQGRIRLVSPLGDARRDRLTFDAPATASEYSLYPELHWLADSSAVLVAVPDPELIYPVEDGDPPRLTTLWRLPVEGEPVRLGTVNATFFGQPRWSPDGAWLTYLEQVGPRTDNTLRLVLASGSGADPVPITSSQVSALLLPKWSAAGYTFERDAPGEVWLGMPGREPARFPGADETVSHLTWADSETAVYVSQQPGGFELRTTNLQTGITGVIASFSAPPSALDAVRVP